MLRLARRDHCGQHLLNEAPDLLAYVVVVERQVRAVMADRADAQTIDHLGMAGCQHHVVGLVVDQ
jgi:hypothetical protein